MFQRCFRFTCPALVLSCLTAMPAFAYVGPGAGLTAFGTMVAVILALVLAVVGFIWFPLKRALRAMREKRADRSADTTDES